MVSRSYGPGRYDPFYEEAGRDYPAGYVRWTEGRNIEESLRLMATEALRPARLTTHVFDLDDAAEAYALLGSSEQSLGILLRYPERDGDDARDRLIRIEAKPRLGRAVNAERPAIGVVGAGVFARSVLMPALARHARIAAVATATGASARASAKRFKAGLATTDPAAIFTADQLDAVVIATRHDTHAEYAERALRAGKHVFVEKPLALGPDELRRIEAAASDSDAVLVVGFNRRFAPLARRLRKELAGHGPLLISYRVNAGPLPRSHWVHDPNVGGGRVVGEMCHFIDLASFLCGAAPTKSVTTAVSGASQPRDDELVTTLTFADGSVATILYSALGDSSLSKERIEVIGEAGAAVLDDFRELHVHRGGRAQTFKSKRDKGHAAEISAFVEACRSGRQPWPVQDMVSVTRMTFAIQDALLGKHDAIP